jgi:simple sugar transport system ATP-binding protein
MKNIHKRFGDVVALDGVTIDIREREVLGLLGENGAGKTTLMNILYGLYKADSGEIYIKGKKVKISSPRDGISNGIFMVHQHFKLVSNFTALENIIIGTAPLSESIKPMRLEDARKKVEEIMDKFKLHVDLDARIRDLPVGVQQRVEILKALYRGAKLLILDEPTTNLTPQEVDMLLKSLKEMVHAGLSVVFITHKIHEVLAVADRITVLRAGKVIGTLPTDKADDVTLVKMMVGERLSIEDSILFRGIKEDLRVGVAEGSPLLEVKGIHVVDELGTEVLKNVNLEVRKGEILGIAGVAGNGQRELVETIVGVRKPIKGKIIIDGIDATNYSPEKILSLGVSYIPEDRLNDGILPTLTVAENIILGFHKFFIKGNKPLLDTNKIRKLSREAILKFNIKTPHELGIAGRLSGGNIQKLMIARALLKNPKILIAHNMTRGLDVAITEFVLREVLRLKRSGSAVLFVSEDLDELLLISDRIAVMYKGQIVGEVPREKFDKYEIGKLMAGISG